MSLLHILIVNMGYSCDPDFQTRNKQAILLFLWAGRLSRKPPGPDFMQDCWFQPLAGRVPVSQMGIEAPAPSPRHEELYLWQRFIASTCAFLLTWLCASIHFWK